MLSAIPHGGMWPFYGLPDRITGAEPSESMYSLTPRKKQKAS